MFALSLPCFYFATKELDTRQCVAPVNFCQLPEGHGLYGSVSVEFSTALCGTCRQATVYNVTRPGAMGMAFVPRAQNSGRLWARERIECSSAGGGWHAAKHGISNDKCISAPMSSPPPGHLAWRGLEGHPTGLGGFDAARFLGLRSSGASNADGIRPNLCSGNSQSRRCCTGVSFGCKSHLAGIST